MARRRYQKGRVFLRGKQPRWIGRWREDLIGQNGSVRRVERSTVLGTKSELPTKKLAQRRLDVLLARVNAPSYRPGRVATLAEFAERWRDQVLSHRKPSTVRVRGSHLRCHILPQLGATRLDEIGRENVQGFVTHLSKQHPYRTVVSVIATLSAMLNTAKLWGYTCEGMQRRGLAMPLQEPGSEARFLTAEQIRQILDIAEEPYSTMFAVLAMTGIRAGELCGLGVDDLDFARRLIYVRRSVWEGRVQTTKNKVSEKALPMPGPLEEILRRHLHTWCPNPMRLLFASRQGTPLRAKKLVERRLHPILDKLGIARCGLHSFRHGLTSLLYERGAPPTVVQAQLRHADPRMTLGVYGHVVEESWRNAVEEAARILRPIAPRSGGAGQCIQQARQPGV